MYSSIAHQRIAFELLNFILNYHTITKNSPRSSLFFGKEKTPNGTHHSTQPHTEALRMLFYKVYSLRFLLDGNVLNLLFFHRSHARSKFFLLAFRIRWLSTSSHCFGLWFTRLPFLSLSLSGSFRLFCWVQNRTDETETKAHTWQCELHNAQCIYNSSCNCIVRFWVGLCENHLK